MALMVGEMAVDFGVLPSEIMRLDALDLGICIIAWREMRLARARRAVKFQALPVTVV